MKEHERNHLRDFNTASRRCDAAFTRLGDTVMIINHIVIRLSKQVEISQQTVSAFPLQALRLSLRRKKKAGKQHTGCLLRHLRQSWEQAGRDKGSPRYQCR